MPTGRVNSPVHTHSLSSLDSYPAETDVTLMLVDSRKETQSILGDLFRANGYKVRIANTASSAFGMANREPQPSLIIADVMMSGMNGFKSLDRLRGAGGDGRDLPVIFLTPGGCADIDETALAAANVDVIEEPLRPAIVLARVRNSLLVSRAKNVLRNSRRLVSPERKSEVERCFIWNLRTEALAHIADARDHETARHMQRSRCYVRFIASALARHEKYARFLNDEVVDAMSHSAALHDVGKAGIPDHILFKPGPLTFEERAVMKEHALLGHTAISMAAKKHVGAPTLLRQVEEIVRSHHECWDGSGYPDGLSGEAIPLSARIMAVADVFDALIDKRVYKDRVTLVEAKRVILNERGKKFDPHIIDVLMSCWQEFENLATDLIIGRKKRV